jgi:hypothetical protein
MCGWQGRAAMAIGPFGFYSRSTNKLNVREGRHGIPQVSPVALPTHFGIGAGAGETLPAGAAPCPTQ